MKHLKISVFVSVLCVVALAQADERRPALAALAPDQQDLLDTWLSLDCQVGNESTRAALTRAGSVLEKALWESFELGPAPAELEELAATSGARFSARQSWLRSHAASLDREVLSILLAQTEQQFRDDELSKLRERRRSSALVALALVGSPQTRERLVALASDLENPASSAARSALSVQER